MEKGKKLLFLENRYKSYLMEEVARQLTSGHEILWLVQNHEFIPGVGRSQIIPYPGRTELAETTEAAEIDLGPIIESDRQLNFFGKKDKRYLFYYAREIGNFLKNERPDVVFGESTVFHELITIEWCRKLSIPYLNPSTCRYPPSRFSFYWYDTLDPAYGEGKPLESSESRKIIDSIVHRKAKPDYMKKVSKPQQEKGRDKWLKTLSYFRGERFNTPHPWIKFQREFNKRKLIRQWDEVAATVVDKEGAFKLLYPLQMQPEANLDVWGRKWRDQTALIDELSRKVPAGAQLFVKPNPKSKYEISEELIGLGTQRDNITLLKHTVPMDEVLPAMDLVVTVTGTIAIECLLSNIPVVTLKETLNNQLTNCRYLESLDQIPAEIQEVKNGRFPRCTEEELEGFISHLNEKSYPGVITDPFSDPGCIGDPNIAALTAAFQHVIAAVGQPQTQLA